MDKWIAVIVIIGSILLAFTIIAAVVFSNRKHRADESGEISEGYWMQQGMSQGTGIGIAIGTALGAAMDNVGLGIAFGLAIGSGIGSGIGASLEKKYADDPRPLSAGKQKNENAAKILGFAILLIGTVVALLTLLIFLKK